MRPHPIMTAVVPAAALWVSALSVGCEGYQDYNELNTCPDPPGNCMTEGEPFYLPSGSSCTQTTEYRCESNLCIGRQCVPSCIEDADCEGEGERCKLVPRTNQRKFDLGQCVQPCTEDPNPTPGGERDGILCVNDQSTDCAGEEPLCVEDGLPATCSEQQLADPCAFGLPTECSVLDEDEFCDRCGCSAAKYCVLDPVQGCADKGDVGAACTAPIQCLSGLCPAGVCVECVQGTDCASGACSADGTCLGAAGEDCTVPADCASGDCSAEGVCAESTAPDAGTVDPDAGAGDPDASASGA